MTDTTPTPRDVYGGTRVDDGGRPVVDDGGRPLTYDSADAAAIEDAALDQGDDGPFDPSTATVEDVNAYLANVDDEAEVDRVLTAERDGKARVGVLEGPHARV